MIIQELNLLHIICELQRLAMSVQKPQLVGYLLKGNRSNFPYVEVSTAWLCDSSRLLLPPYEVGKCYNKKPSKYCKVQ